MTQPTIVTPNVPGDIIIGDHNFKVNNNYGTIIYKPASASARPLPSRPASPATL
jgi:hypothetical protein